MATETRPTANACKNTHRLTALFVFSLLFYLPALGYCSSEEQPVDLYKTSEEIFMQGRKKEAALYLARAFDNQWTKNGAAILASDAHLLRGASDGQHFVWKEDTTITHFNLADRTSRTFDWEHHFDEYMLSPTGRSVIFLRNPRLKEDKCLINILEIPTEKISDTLALPRCTSHNFTVDLPWSLDNLPVKPDDIKTIGLESFQKRSPDNRTAEGRFTYALFPLDDGLTLFDPFTGKKKVIMGYKHLPSPYKLVPPKTVVYQIPGTTQILLIRGNGGVYNLFLIDLNGGVVTRYPFNLKLPYVNLSPDGESILVIKAAGSQERIFRVYLFENRQKRYKSARRDEPFDDTAGNIYYYQNDKLYQIPVIGPARSLPFSMRNFIPLTANRYLIETFAENIVLTELRFDDVMRKWHRRLDQYLEAASN